MFKDYFSDILYKQFYMKLEFSPKEYIHTL